MIHAKDDRQPLLWGYHYFFIRGLLERIVKARLASGKFVVEIDNNTVALFLAAFRIVVWAYTIVILVVFDKRHVRCTLVGLARRIQLRLSQK